jgi:calcineurin-like phosphoesterase family protein
MSQNFYISDLHFGHANVIKFDKRPFATIEEMDTALIRNWNEAVRKNDNIYILGDFCWGKSEQWVELLSQLRGNKYLIAGNHDIKNPSSTVRRYFQDWKDYKEIDDKGRRVILCHYPIPFYKSDYSESTFMLHGHVHITFENEYLENLRYQIENDPYERSAKNLCQFYNVGCMMPWMNYRPRTLDEIVSGFAQFH